MTPQQVSLDCLLLPTQEPTAHDHRGSFISKTYHDINAKNDISERLFIFVKTIRKIRKNGIYCSA